VAIGLGIFVLIKSLRIGYSPMEARAVFQLADVDKNGFLDEEEVKHLLARLNPLASRRIPEVLRKPFQCPSSGTSIEMMTGNGNKNQVITYNQ
jgi:Ca2+-binding EF-hand superfamily protein